MATELGTGPLEPETPGFGKLGQSEKDYELDRIARAPVDHAPVPVKDRQPTLAAEQMRALRLVVREQLMEMTNAVASLRQDIDNSNLLLRHIDTPLETVADAHERATHSFETLRGEFMQCTAKVDGFGSRLDAMELLLRRIAKQVGVA